MGEDDSGPGRFDVLDHAPVGMCVLDKARRVLFWNHCLEHWTGIPRGEILGEDVARRFPHFDTPRYSLRLEAIHQGGAPAIFSSQLHGHLFPAPLPNGQFRTQHTTVTAVPAPDGCGFLALFAVEDVTEMTQRIQAYRRMRDQAVAEIEQRRQAEHKKELLLTRLHEAQKRESLNVMAGSIAHSFNNLLMAILGYLDMAKEEMPSTSSSLDKVERAHASAQQAAELSRLMLTYVGQADVEFDLLDLASLIKDMAETLEARLSQGTALSFRPAEQPVLLKGDPAHLRQLVEHLVTNAAEAVGDDGGAINLATGTVNYDPDRSAAPPEGAELTKGDYIFLDVKDSGCGMDPETLARVFDPFFTTKFTGRGLGLAAALGIVRAHRGGITITSVPGKGTSVRVLLPMTPETAPHGQAPAASLEDEEKASLTKPMTILLADDDEAVRTSCAAMLRRLGQEVLTAVDGQEAVEIFREEHGAIDCAILDLTMPNMGGEETMAELRRIRDDVRVVLVSGYSQEDLTHPPARPGADGFIQKPFSLTALRDALREVCGEVEGRAGGGWPTGTTWIGA